MLIKLKYFAIIMLSMLIRLSTKILEDYVKIFELICVCAWESVSKSGQSFKNDIKWGCSCHSLYLTTFLPIIP